MQVRHTQEESLGSEANGEHVLAILARTYLLHSFPLHTVTEIRRFTDMDGATAPVQQMSLFI